MIQQNHDKRNQSCEVPSIPQKETRRPPITFPRNQELPRAKTLIRGVIPRIRIQTRQDRISRCIIRIDTARLLITTEINRTTQKIPIIRSCSCDQPEGNQTNPDSKNCVVELIARQQIGKIKIPELLDLLKA